ncbi:MAG: FAD-binding oxidoreductase [Desulfovibrio sp.]
MQYAAALSHKHKAFLKKTFPADALFFHKDETVLFGVDSSRLSAQPWAVVCADSVEQVQALLRFAHKERIPVYPRARGTNMVGATVPCHGGIVLSTLRMNKIIDIDGDDFVAEVQPGVVTADLQKAVEAQRLFYPPDPASLKISTIGGNVSTCAGGMRAVKYGVTREYVLGVEVVLPTGEIVRSGGRAHKNVVGLDIARLMCGSAGTLGVITRLWMKLIPLPEQTASVLAGFSSFENALTAARDVFRAGMLPTAMEFMDGNAMRALSMAGEVPWPDSTKAALLFRVDGSEESVAAEVTRLEQALSSVGPTSLQKGIGAEAEEPLWEVRRRISPSAFKLGPDKMGEDIAVPRGKTLEAVTKFHTIGQKCGVEILCFGHLGDGNIHTNIMYDRSDTASLAGAKEAKSLVFDVVLGLGGTLSGEHGTGLTKGPYLNQQLSGDELALLTRVKHAFDPHNIMNPDKGW